MMVRMQTAILLSLLILATTGQASWRSKVRAGDKLYREQKYDEALVKYLEALRDQGDSTLIKFDLGNVFHSQEKFDEAQKAFQSALHSSDSTTVADAFYNLGNALVGAGQYQQAVAAYKSALRLHPRQLDYLHNLELALHLMQNPPQQQQPNQKNQEQQDKQDNQKEQKQQDKEQQQEQKKQPEEQQQENQQQQSEEQKQTMAADSSMSKEDAERLLNALQLDEKQVQETLHRQPAVETGVAKDW